MIKKILLAVLIVVPIMIVAGIAAYVVNNKKEDPKPQLTQYKSEWKILEVKHIGKSIPSKITGQKDCTTDAGKKFVYLQFTGKNTNDVKLFHPNIRLVDEKNNMYFSVDEKCALGAKTTATDEFYPFARPLSTIDPQNQSELFKDNFLNPGAQKQFYVVFQVPESFNKMKMLIREDEDRYFDIQF